MPEPTKFLLSEADIPSRWINLLPDLPGEPLPPLSPATGQPAGPEDLTPIFPMGLIAQEVSMEPEVEIPEEVGDPVEPGQCAFARSLDDVVFDPAGSCLIAQPTP